MQTEYAVVGASPPRRGLADKIRGEALYTADLKQPDMLYARVLRSPHAHARVVKVHTDAALRLPGVQAVITHLDVPHVRIDEDLLPLDPIVRYVGDEVAVVAAENEVLAEDALRLIQVDYEVLPAVFEAEAALQPEAAPIHPQGNLVGGGELVVVRGDVTAGFAAADRIFEGTFRTQVHAPAGMETRAALAAWEGDELTVWKTSRAVHANDRQILSQVLGIPQERIRVVCTHMGGGFGNKDESRLPVLTALLAQQAGRPVRLEYSRAEEFVAGRNRQSSVNHLRIGVNKDGAPTAVEMCSVMNAGAYVSTGIRVTRRTGQGPLYLYTCPHARYEGVTAYTNRSAGGSFRGLGAPLGHFALEVLIDQIAEAMEMDPLDYRLRFHVSQEGQPGERTTPLEELIPDEPAEGGVPFSSNGLHECLLAGAERIGWRERRQPHGTATGPIRRGLGVAMGTYKGGVGRDAEAEVRLTPAGRVVVHIGNVDVGQGSTTLLAQIAAVTLQVPHHVVDMVMADTAHTPPAHITAGSSTTITSGAAVKLAAEDAHRHLLDHAGAPGGDTVAMMTALPAEIAGTGQVMSGSTDYIINTFMAHFAEVEVDMLSGRVRVLRYVAAHDSGRIIHPRMAQNQVSGGVLQFLGIALREELFVDESSGVTLNPSFLEHKFTSIVDFPTIEVLFPAGPDPLGPYGAKALGEPPVVPVFAAVANAVANASGVWLHEVPFTPQRVLSAIREQGRAAA
ncbi:xanthine dehydrogenase family protein molybdopterin-binding subunit [Candidatus Entotheonella palauensis]|uniref:xanthine dehydrogenase family protein molybdopterin-binding subunit n=1 Tax=Candidatus Entotheonella palauensis TaxID=93172 RepID=UPI000B7C8A12|nr:molybdopterin cofactor-binding domain-containing protein [Candidatus Entotheonella palauensis]